MATKIGHGILAWDGAERRSNRYGSIHLFASNFEENVSAEVDIDFNSLVQFEGKKVRLICKVVKARKSGHVGDSFLKILPSKPKVGEVIDLGVGIFTSTVGLDGGPDLVLQPGDGREDLWIDPRKLYRVHDQTVDVFIEETTDDFSPRPDIQILDDESAVSFGDGSFQVKTKHPNGSSYNIPPHVERLGDGLSVISCVGSTPKGTVHKLERSR